MAVYRCLACIYYLGVMMDNLELAFLVGCGVTILLFVGSLWRSIKIKDIGSAYLSFSGALWVVIALMNFLFWQRVL